MLIKYIILGLCVLAFCGPVAAAEVTSRGATDPAPSPSPVFDPPCDGAIAGSSPARALADALVNAGKSDYVGAVENVLSIPAVKAAMPNGMLQLFHMQKVDVGACIRLCVAIPSSSQIIAYRFAARNNAPVDWVACSSAEAECSIGFAMFKTPDISDQGGPKVVCSVFKNWSHTFGREGSFTVEYN